MEKTIINGFVLKAVQKLQPSQLRSSNLSNLKNGKEKK
jgi:hypothetical protein